MLRAVDIFDPRASSECERAVLEVVSLTFSQRLTGAAFRYRAERVFESLIDAHCSQLEMFVRSKLHETESLTRCFVPKSWVDAFKLRWFPRWALKRFPAKQREIITSHRQVFHVCPHLPARPDQTHVEYLIRKERV